MQEHELVNYTATASEYLRRAKSQLELFDRGHWPSLFYAALELRLGIEMRLETYLSAAQKEKPKTKKYLGKDLRKELLNNNPDASREVTLIMSVGNQPVSAMKYIPVTEKLANEYYGRLGNLLHWKFKSQKGWTRYSWWKQQRQYLQEVYDELSRACSGVMLGPMKVK